MSSDRYINTYWFHNVMWVFLHSKIYLLFDCSLCTIMAQVHILMHTSIPSSFPVLSLQSLDVSFAFSCLHSFFTYIQQILCDFDHTSFIFLFHMYHVPLHIKKGPGSKLLLSRLVNCATVVAKKHA